MSRLNWRKFFFRLTAVLSLLSAVFFFILALTSDVRNMPSFYPIIATACGFLGVWLFYGFCHALYEIGKWIYQGLVDKEE